MRVLVIGAGVSGLTTGVILAEAGHGVHVVAKDVSPGTTSDVAAAIWYPYKAEPFGDVKRWGLISLATFRKLATDPATGIRLVPGTRLFHRPMGNPWWRDAAPSFRRLTREEVAGHAAVSGYAFTMPIIDMSVYLPYLMKRFHAAGGTVEIRECRSLADEAGFDGIANCTGLGARALAKDPSVYPIRGQLVSVEDSTPEFLLDEDNPAGLTYIIPRLDRTCLGGVAHAGNWSTEIDPAQTVAILSRCRSLYPALSRARVSGSAVGLRPGRPSLRVERDQSTGVLIVHNYGHGGSGVTLSWGSAEEAVRLLTMGT